MNLYSFICVILFLSCFIFIDVAIRHTKQKSKTMVKTDNVKSKEIVGLLRIKNDYEKILTVFNDLDDRCKELNVNITPDFGGYFE